MFLNISSAARESVSSLTPSVLSSGSAGGGGPLGCGGCEFSFPSGTVPTPDEYAFFLLPNQLPLFLLDTLGWLLMVAGEPGLSDLRLSDDDRVRRPRNLRTDPGRRGLVGDITLAASLGRLCAFPPSASVPLCGAEPSNLGAGCEDNGPCPGVGGRGVSGGLSSGAGIAVPSVREKLMGVSVNGFHSNLPTGMMKQGRGVGCADQ